MENYFQMNFTVQQVNAISSLGLAHMGDGVYELFCRAHLCASGNQTVLKLHKDTVRKYMYKADKFGWSRYKNKCVNNRSTLIC